MPSRTTRWHGLGADGPRMGQAPADREGTAVRWLEIATTEIEEARDRAGGVALVPIGSIETHGPHLPVGCDALVVVTEWNEFKQLDLQRIRDLMRRPVLFDGRNIYDPVMIRQLGFEYRGVGRGYNGSKLNLEPNGFGVQVPA